MFLAIFWATFSIAPNCTFCHLHIFWRFSSFCVTLPIAPNCTQSHSLAPFAIFTYFDVSLHSESEQLCQSHLIAPNCTFLPFSHISTFLVILRNFVNCTRLHPISPNCACHAPSEGYKKECCTTLKSVCIWSSKNQHLQEHTVAELWNQDPRWEVWWIQS